MEWVDMCVVSPHSTYSNITKHVWGPVCSVSSLVVSGCFQVHRSREDKAIRDLGPEGLGQGVRSMLSQKGKSSLGQAGSQSGWEWMLSAKVRRRVQAFFIRLSVVLIGSLPLIIFNKAALWGGLSLFVFLYWWRMWMHMLYSRWTRDYLILGNDMTISRKGASLAWRSILGVVLCDWLPMVTLVEGYG